MQNISPEELNTYITGITSDIGSQLPPAKTWTRIDVGPIETYVGDGIYVISVVNHRPKDIQELEANSAKAQQKVIAYLKGEGFIDVEYFYIGLQTLDLQSPFNDV